MSSHKHRRAQGAVLMAYTYVNHISPAKQYPVCLVSLQDVGGMPSVDWDICRSDMGGEVDYVVLTTLPGFQR